MNDLTAKPPYEWDVATVGDTLPPRDTTVGYDLVQLYMDTSGDRNPVFTDAALARSCGLPGTTVPASMAMRVASTRRTTIMDAKGYSHPVRPTPFAKWECEFFAPITPGDVITANSQLDHKYEKNGRKYLVWKVTARNQRGEPVIEYRSTNAWEGSKPGDRSR